MNASNIQKAQAYYRAIGLQNFEEAQSYLHPEVELISPLAHLTGKEAVTKAVKNFMNMIEALRIKSSFSSGDQAMIVYHIDIPEMIQNFPAAALLEFSEGLVKRFDLFYDGSHFQENKKTIFEES